MERIPTPAPDRFAALWRSLRGIGFLPRVGCSRLAWSETDLAAREWFVEEAIDRNLTVESDGNGNLVAWWGDPAGGPAVLTGSHLDSSPGGGPYRGALGVVSALLAVDVLRERGYTPRRPVGIAVFGATDGARFGEPCAGVRLLTGDLPVEAARRLRDRDGTTFVDALTAALPAAPPPRALPAEVTDAIGLPTPAAVPHGPDPLRLAGIGAFVELHLDPGATVTALDASVGVCAGAWAAGRWRLEVTGTRNHTGTTAMSDRADPALTVAYAVLAVNKEARQRGAHAGVGRLTTHPGTAEAIAAEATAWIEARAPRAATIDEFGAALAARITERAERDGTVAALTAGAMTPAVGFHADLCQRIGARLGGVPTVSSAATHVATAMAPHVPTAMLLVRNPTGVYDAPAERATDIDCAAGVAALAMVLADLAGDADLPTMTA